MGYHKHSVLIVSQIILKPAYCIYVKVIGRLIKQQVVRLAKESTRKQDSHLLLTAHILHKGVVELLLYAQAAKQRCSVTLSVPAVHLCKLLLQLRRPDTVSLSKILLCIYGVLLLLNLPEFVMPHHHRINNCELIKLKVVLLQHREALVRPE